MPLLKYTTGIDADKTAAEIAKCLSKHGAKAVLTEYDPENSFISALSFKIGLNGNDIAFRLPCDWKPVLTILENDNKVPVRLKTREQAVRVSWRIVLTWIEAQMAIIETKMVRVEEVFLPYAVMSDGKLLSEKVLNENFLLNDGK